jgi:hypothetical protein
VKRPAAIWSPEDEAAWSRFRDGVLGPALRTLGALRRAGVPREAFGLADEFLPWIRAARALPVLREYHARLSGFDYTFDDVKASTRRALDDCEEILGSRWRPGRNLERDTRFGDLVVRIYEAIKPHVSGTPQRRRPEQRQQPIVYSMSAAALTAQLVNFTCAKALGHSITARYVFGRVNRRRA